MAIIRAGKCLVAIVAAIVLVTKLSWADWPAYRHDGARSGVTSEPLSLPLAQSWAYQAPQPPHRAWPRPFRENAETKVKVAPLLTFDHAYQPVAGGGKVYFGSSGDHQVYCLDAATGKKIWTFFTEGPVRMAPTIWGQKLYVGSDDGRVYCLRTDNGNLVWQYGLGPSDARLPGNERMISRWPIRSGIVVDGGIAYAAAGLFPQRVGCHLAAIDAETGKPLWNQKINQVTQGYLLASQSTVIVPSGKLRPSVYAREGGKLISDVQVPRGNFALIQDDILYVGPSISGGQIGAVSARRTRENLATFEGNHMVVGPDRLFILTDNRLKSVCRYRMQLLRLERQRDRLSAALDKAKSDPQQIQAHRGQLSSLQTEISTLKKASKDVKNWAIRCDCPDSLILAGTLLFAGGDHKVVAFDRANGREQWSQQVNGKAHGLAVADGNLYVSTDTGWLHCFSAAHVPSGEDRPVASGVELPKQVAQDSEPQENADTSSLYAAAAKTICQPSSAGPGYCLVLGAGQGQLALEIARRTRFHVVIAEPDADRAGDVRRMLDQTGLYGARVVVHHVPLETLPYPPYVFNLIASEAAIATGQLPPADEIYRVLHPYGVARIGQPPGGTLTLDALNDWARATSLEKADLHQDDTGLWATVRRGPLAGAGQWTHQYANPANTTCSEDQRISGDLELQWFGRPGPYHMFDRHSFPAAPVAAKGRVFTLGERVLFGNDVYNGALLWTATLAGLEPRVNIPRDCGYMATDGEAVYVAAANQCLRIDAATGQRGAAIPLPTDSANPQQQYDWGYVARVDQLLVGSAVRKGAFYTDGRGPWYDDSGFHTPADSLKVLSDTLFTVNANDGLPGWQYKGVIVNSTITVGGGRIYFIENRSPEVIADASRRLAGGDTWKRLQLVALNMHSGEKVWEKELSFEQRTPVLFGVYKNEIFALLRSFGTFDLRAFNAANGDPVWAKQHKWEIDNHGGHRRHPVIMGNVVYQHPHAYDLKTGTVQWSVASGSLGCGTLSASSEMLFCRLGSYPGMLDVKKKAASEIIVQVTRPGCWINIIPAEGMVLIPEAASGCTCDFAIHATMGFLAQ